MCRRVGHRPGADALSRISPFSLCLSTPFLFILNSGNLPRTGPTGFGNLLMSDMNLSRRRSGRGPAGRIALLILAAGLTLAATSPGRTQTPASGELDKDHAAKMAKGLALFKAHVKPTLLKRCVRCHGGDKTRGEFDMTDRAELLKGGSHGPAVLPGKSKASFLYQVISHQREPHMPQNGRQLPAQEIAYIAQWIDLGAP